MEVDLVLLALGFLGPVKNGMLEQLGVNLDQRGNIATGAADRRGDCRQRGLGKPRAEAQHVAEATAEDILWADAVIFGSPTRFGNIASQLKQFIDTLGGPWMQGQLADKVYSGESSWVTGQNFCIDGGVTAGYR